MLGVIMPIDYDVKEARLHNALGGFGIVDNRKEAPEHLYLRINALQSDMGMLAGDGLQHASITVIVAKDNMDRPLKAAS